MLTDQENILLRRKNDENVSESVRPLPHRVGLHGSPSHQQRRAIGESWLSLIGYVVRNVVHCPEHHLPYNACYILRCEVDKGQTAPF